MNPAQRDLVFVDLETSGLDPGVHEILELAAVRTAPDAKTERGYVNRRVCLQHPERASAEALSVNGYDPAQWQSAVPVRMAIVEWLDLIGTDEPIWVGHHPHFDLDFLRAAFHQEGLALPKTKYVLDTLSLAWPLAARGFVNRMSLDALCSRYKIPNTGAHRAMPDVRRTMALYRCLLGMESL